MSGASLATAEESIWHGAWIADDWFGLKRWIIVRIPEIMVTIPEVAPIRSKE
jgi:hypothetical protein